MFWLSVTKGIILLGVLVFIHELGHFLTAKWLGVRVLKFSLGFGKKVIGRKRGETEYQIAAIPLGGYVKLLGESPDEEVPESEQSCSFTGQSVIRRMLIVGAGPVMNLLLALVIFPLVFMIGIQQPSYLSTKPVIGWVEPESPAAEQGFRPGDQIMAINGRSISDWESLTIRILTSPGEKLTIEFERDGRMMSKRLVPIPAAETGAGMAGFQPSVPKMVVNRVVEGGPAAEAGIRTGDFILSVNGSPNQDYLTMRKLIEKSAGKSLAVDIRRGEQVLSLTMTPVLDPEEPVGRIGIQFTPGFPDIDFVTRSYGLLQAVERGGHEVVRLTRLTFAVLGKLITRKLSFRHVGGPISIVQIASQAAESGFISLLQFAAFISLNLAIFNVLPIPVLDGGHLALLLVESIIGKPVSARKQEMAYKIGFTILIVLMLVVSYNDIVRVFFGLP
jgi:regulator of sigma E protease